MHIQTELTQQFHILITEVIEVLQNASDDAIARIPSIPGSFRRHTIIDYALLYRRSESVHKKCLTALEILFSTISDWAVPLHTLPPLASPPTSSKSSEIQAEAESLFEKIKSPFHRQRYEYEKLPTPFSFRLVKVDKARPYVICEMETFHLRDPPAFQALSYCWGTFGRRSDIWINNQLLQVSPNLKRGLQTLYKYYSRWATDSWVWIDQISINQEDFAERTQQVRLMRAIYQQATTTVIWLGPDDGYAGPAFQLAAAVYQFSLHVRADEQKEKERGSVTPERSLVLAPPLHGIDLPSPEDKRWEVLLRFLELAWFERCWIIQEGENIPFQIGVS